jgi:hypothetical protein
MSNLPSCSLGLGCHKDRLQLLLSTRLHNGYLFGVRNEIFLCL